SRVLAIVRYSEAAWRRCRALQTQTVLVFTNSRIPWTPNSRPMALLIDIRAIGSPVTSTCTRVYRHSTCTGNYKGACNENNIPYDHSVSAHWGRVQYSSVR